MTENRKTFFQCRKCGKTYEKVAWYEKHKAKCKIETPPVKAEDDEGRNPDGSFAPGNKIGKGNPHWTKLKRYREDYLKIFQDVMTPERMQSVILAMLHKALQGEDVPALKCLMEYAMGKPVQRIEDDVEGGPERKALQIAEALKALDM